MNREDCFANLGKECSCLKEKNCYACKFYRNDVNRKDLEKDVASYINPKSVNKKWV